MKKSKWYMLILACNFWGTYSLGQNIVINRMEGQTPFSTPSDGRFKLRVREDVKGLDFILQLRPVTYQYDVKRFDEQLRGKNNKSNSYGLDDSATYRIQAERAMESGYKEASAIRRSGFIAQEVEKAANASGYNFSGLGKPQNDQAYYSLRYESFVVPLVKGMQEQQKLITDMRKIITDLQKQIDALKQQLSK